jgi:hypothetical protein
MGQLPRRALSEHFAEYEIKHPARPGQLHPPRLAIEPAILSREKSHPQIPGPWQRLPRCTRGSLRTKVLFQRGSNVHVGTHIV